MSLTEVGDVYRAFLSQLSEPLRERGSEIPLFLRKPHHPAARKVEDLGREGGVFLEVLGALQPDLLMR